MTPVNARGYNSPVRREQATRTRQRILNAAAELFPDRGYGATSIRAIAEAAQVAPDTVYATFGSKARVLTALSTTGSRLVASPASSTGPRSR